MNLKIHLSPKSCKQGNSTTYSWVYDDLYRLKQETRTPSGSSAVVTNYDYDRTGNRLSEEVVGGQRTDYTYSALDQLTSISIDSGPALVYGYDSRGNMTSKPDGTAYAYDAMDRLVEVDLPDTMHMDYSYDWDGRRIQKDVDSGTEVINYLWDEFSPFGDVVLETDDTSTVLGNYTLANGQLVSQTRSGVDRFYLADGQHSIRALVDDAGTVNITDNYTYTAFGEILTSNETTENPYRYTGQQYDELTGLYSLRARYYNPTDGRFLTRDSYPFDLKNPNELNRYAYVANNPINLFDPTGLKGLVGYASTIKSAALYIATGEQKYLPASLIGQSIFVFLQGGFEGFLGYMVGLFAYNATYGNAHSWDDLLNNFDPIALIGAIAFGGAFAVGHYWIEKTFRDYQDEVATWYPGKSRKHKNKRNAALVTSFLLEVFNIVPLYGLISVGLEEYITKLLDEASGEIHQSRGVWQAAILVFENALQAALRYKSKGDNPSDHRFGILIAVMVNTVDEMIAQYGTNH